MLFAHTLLLGAVLLIVSVPLALGRPYNPFEDYVPSVASIAESIAYLLEPRAAAHSEPERIIEKRQSNYGYYFIPGPPPPPPRPVIISAPAPPSIPEPPPPPRPQPQPRPRPPPSQPAPYSSVEEINNSGASTENYS